MATSPGWIYRLELALSARYRRVPLEETPNCKALASEAEKQRADTASSRAQAEDELEVRQAAKAPGQHVLIPRVCESHSGDLHCCREIVCEKKIFARWIGRSEWRLGVVEHGLEMSVCGAFSSLPGGEAVVLGGKRKARLSLRGSTPLFTRLAAGTCR